MAKFQSTKKTYSEDSEAYDYHMSLFNDFQEIYRRAEENKNLIFFEHWTEEEKRKHYEEERTPVNFPLLYRLVMNLLGYEKNYPAILQTEPVGKEDEIESFKYNLSLKHIQENTAPVRYKYQRSDVFMNGVVALYGVSEICVRTDELGENEIYIKSIPYNQVMFDKNFTDYEMTGCSRVQYFEDLYADEIIKDYPEKREEILSMAETMYDTNTSRYRTLKNFYSQSEQSKGRKLLRKITDYKKEIKEYYCVYVDDRAYEFDTKQQAMDYAQTINGGGAINGMTGDATGGATVSERRYLTCYYKTVLVNDVVVEDKVILPVRDECPLTFYFSVFINGEVTNVVEVTKDLQKYQDRMYSQMDYNMGVAGKILYEINKTRLDRSQSDEDIDRAIKKGGRIYTNTDNKVIKQNTTTPLDPQYFMVHEMIMRLAEDVYGGKNFQGVQQYSNQSGIAIEKLQAAATLIASTYIDNLERYAESLGRKLIKYIKHYYTQKKSFKIIGDYNNKQLINVLEKNQIYEPSIVSKNVGYVTINDPNNPESKLSGSFKYNLKIVNKDYNQYDKENLVQKLLMLQQQGLKVPPDLLLEIMIDDPVVRQRLLDEYEQEKQMQQAQAVEQEKTSRLDAMGKNLAVLQKDKQAAAEQVTAEEQADMAAQQQAAETPAGSPEDTGAGSPQDLSGMVEDIIKYM